MKSIPLIAVVTLTGFVSPIWALQNSSPHSPSIMIMNPSQEARENMANAYEKMAACFRSDQEFKVCHNILKTECESILGGHCEHMGMKRK
jgi:hypothetical protein